jgi:hypothetical protein
MSTNTGVVAVGVEIRGAEQLVALSKRLTAMGQSGLRDELRRGLRDAAKPAGPAVRRAALDTLPKKGGLNRRVADQVSPVVKDMPAGVRLILDRGSRTIDRGTVRHPVFGDRKRWVNEHVHPGFWTGTLSEMALDFDRGMQKVLDRIERKVSP